MDCDFNYTNRPLLIKHLEDVYGKEKVCHIGAWTTMSIYTSIKDFARVLNVPVATANAINKGLKAICGEDPNACFKIFDDMEENNPSGYKAFKEFEKQCPEVFRLARKFEGCIRQWTTHASGVIACPKTVTDLVPTRKDPKTGDTVCLFTGVELESIGIIKYDILGLKTLTMIENTLKSIGKTFEDLYREADITDKDTYDMICRGETDSVFQIESNMMKGLVKSIQPNTLDDLSALVAIGRPGPLSCGTDKQYAEWKKDPSKIKEYLPNISDITARSAGTLIYQEQLMQISIKCFGFNQSQSDSIVRKILGKKKIKQLPMLRRMMIYGMKTGKGPEGWEDNQDMCWYDEDGHYGDPIPGGIAMGYKKDDIEKFFDSIQGFASYCFNLSHSLCYGYISFLTAWLKCHYPSQWIAAVISMQTDDEKKTHYLAVAEEMGVKVMPPDVNRSKSSFTAISNDTITYGLSSVKMVKRVDDIIANAPYQSLEDAFDRIPSASFNKRIAENLIKAGAFDFEDSNRNRMLNKLARMRVARGFKLNRERSKQIMTLTDEDEKEALRQKFIDEDAKDSYISEEFTKEDCMKYESETLGTSITYKPAWKGAMAGQPLNGNCTFSKIKEHITKSSNKEMAMLTVTNETYDVEALVFPRQYPKFKSILKNYGKEDSPDTYFVRGKMDKEGKKLIIDSIEPAHNTHIQTDMMETPDGAPVFDFNPLEFSL